jgi:carbonic anhydrase
MANRPVSRRSILSLAAVPPLYSQTQKSLTPRLSADDSLKALMEGNARFLEGRTTSPRRTPADIAALASRQAPAAIIIGCADSRVPPEILFDQGLCDLFVIRVAGNVVNPAEPGVMGSMTFAVLELGVPLIMVLGHSNCGAVKAAVDGNKDSLPASIRELVSLVRTGSERDLDQAIAANVRAGVAQVKDVEPNLKRRVQKHQLKVVGGVYDLSSGCVSLLS